MDNASTAGLNGFKLGTPALVCRWRLANRHLPLENRHLRALLARTVNGSRVTPELAAWAKQHMEWTLEQGAAAHPDGTLMLVIDTQGRAAMTAGPYVPLGDTTTAGILARAEQAHSEAAATGVAPETLWVARGGQLLWDPGEGCSASGAASLVEQLAQTMGIEVQVCPGLIDAAREDTFARTEVFLVSDEHGVVPACDATGELGTRLAQGYERLLAVRPGGRPNAT